MFRSLGDVHNMSKTYGRLSKLAASQEVRVEVLRQALTDYITGLVALGYPSLAVQVYEDIGRTADFELIQVSNVMTAMLEAYSHLNKHSEVVQLFDKMAAASVGLSYQMILRVIVSRLALQQTSKARSMYKTLEEQVLSGGSKTSGGGPVTGVGPTLRLSHTFEDLAKMALNKDGFPATRPTCEDKSILETLKDDPSAQNYEKAINQFALGGDLKLAEQLLNDWMNKSASNSTGSIASSSSSIRPPTSSMVSALVNGSIRLNNGHFLDLIETHKIKPTMSLTRSIVQFHLKRRDPTMAASVLLKSLTKKSSTIGNAILTSILTSFNLGHASALPAGANFYHQVVATIPDELTIEFFNAALQLFTKMMDGDSITGILSLIKSRSLVPNVTTYTCLMQIYLKKPDYKMAVTTYMQILEQGLVPDSAAVLALATALGESKALAHAKSVRFLQEQLDYCPLDPTPTALEVLQKACNLAENPSAFAILLDTLKQKFNIQLTTEQYMAWLTSLLEFDDIPAAIDLAISVSGLARRKPDILTRAFCCRLALHISEQVGTDFPMDSLDRWIVDPSAGSLTLEPGELLKFQADLKTWASFYPSRQRF
jgi:pentatricopeptide repeat protein